MTEKYQSWQRAWAANNFYLREQPEHHFTTGVGLGDAIAQVMVAELISLQDRLIRDQVITVIDIGCGSAQLLIRMQELCAVDAPQILKRSRWVGVDVRSRPPNLPRSIDWWQGSAPEILHEYAPHGVQGLLIAHEWLDDIPCTIVQVDGRGELREVLVDVQSGNESLGEVLATDDPRFAWLQQWWWPVRHRAEIGVLRDTAWAKACSVLRVGTAIAVDYAHTRADRQHERWDGGTLAAYRDSRIVRPIPDGSCNITAHVALDACAAAVGEAATLRTQREVLVAQPLPDAGASVADPISYARALEQANQSLRLRDRAGMGQFMWLRQDIGVPARAVGS